MEQRKGNPKERERKKGNEGMEREGEYRRNGERGREETKEGE